jgi:hypothetical protein
MEDYLPPWQTSGLSQIGFSALGPQLIASGDSVLARQPAWIGIRIKSEVSLNTCFI